MQRWALCHATSITQQQLAEQTRCSEIAIAEAEQGKRDLRASTIQKLCVALGVTVVHRVDGTEITGP
jgi:transcriptional regulator with XRE-family HTH domain